MSKKRVFKDEAEAQAWKDKGADSLSHLDSDAADSIDSMSLDEWLEAHGHRIAENPSRISRKARRKNLDHPDSSHQVKVHQYWRSGGASQWQRAAKAGQHDLFAHGIKVKNPAEALRALQQCGLSRTEARRVLEQLAMRREPSERSKIMPTTKGDLLDALQEVADVLQPFIDSGDIEIGTEEESDEEEE